MNKGFVVVLVALVAIVAGLQVAYRNSIPKPPQLSENVTRVLFTGHMYALTNAQKGKKLKEYMKDEMASLIVVGGDSISGDSLAHLEGKEFSLDLLQNQWQKFDAFFSGISGDVLVLPGNHDLLTSKGETVASEMRANISRRSSFENFYGKRTIDRCSTYYLNTMDLKTSVPSFQLDQEQLQWLLTSLDQDLSNGISCVVLFQHHRLWEMDKYTSRLKGDVSQFGLIERRLVKFSTAIVCAGDLGIIEEIEKNGITYFNVSNMIGHSGYVRLDFLGDEVSTQLAELGSGAIVRIRYLISFLLHALS